jgi:nucleotide-binding universal stress UspA family protein
MALKDILVCLDATEAGEKRLRLAAAMARDCGAHLSAAFVLPEQIAGAPPDGGIVVAPPTGAAWLPQFGLGAVVPPPDPDADVTPVPSVADIIEQRFRDEVRTYAIEGESHMFAAGESGELIALARTMDLVVYGQAAPDYRLPTGFRPEDIIVGSGRPLLVVPYAGTFEAVGRRVLIAWDGSREAARAVHDALPLIAAAEAATVITVRDDADADFARNAPSIARLVRHLARHGIAAARDEQASRGSLPIADLLLSRAADLAVDLIVAGAYHHSQFREALIGGVSRSLLDHMTVPVLMSH